MKQSIYIITGGWMVELVKYNLQPVNKRYVKYSSLKNAKILNTFKKSSKISKKKNTQISQKKKTDLLGY